MAIMRFRFREIREIKREEKNLHRGYDPDKRIDPVESILKQAQANADRAWNDFAEYAKAYDPDKRIEVS